MMPRRIQRSRAAGWRKPVGAIIVTRPSMFGNPFAVAEYGQEGAVEMFNRWLDETLSAEELHHAPRIEHGGMSLSSRRHMLTSHLFVLRGKDLCCWCALVDANGKPVPCHADILLERANK